MNRWLLFAAAAIDFGKGGVSRPSSGTFCTRNGDRRAKRKAKDVKESRFFAEAERRHAEGEVEVCCEVA